MRINQRIRLWKGTSVGITIPLDSGRKKRGGGCGCLFLALIALLFVGSMGGLMNAGKNRKSDIADHPKKTDHPQKIEEKEAVAIEPSKPQLPLPKRVPIIPPGPVMLTDKTGRTLNARIVAINDSEVSIERVQDGQSFTIPLLRLDEKSLQLVNAIRKQSVSGRLGDSPEQFEAMFGEPWGQNAPNDLKFYRLAGMTIDVKFEDEKAVGIILEHPSSADPKLYDPIPDFLIQTSLAVNSRGQEWMMKKTNNLTGWESEDFTQRAIYYNGENIFVLGTRDFLTRQQALNAAAGKHASP